MKDAEIEERLQLLQQEVTLAGEAVETPVLSDASAPKLHKAR